MLFTTLRSAISSSWRLPASLRPSGAIGEALVANWQAANLIKPSAIKPVITTIEQALVIRRLGQLAIEDQQSLRTAIAKIVG